MSNKVLDPPVVIGKNLNAIAIQDGDLMVQHKEEDPVLLGSFLAHTHGGAGWELEEPTMLSLLGTPAAIENKDRFLTAKWVEIPKRIGTVGDQNLYFLGTDDGEALVGKLDPDEPILFAVPLNELISHSTDSIVIPNPLPSEPS